MSRASFARGNRFLRAEIYRLVGHDIVEWHSGIPGFGLRTRKSGVQSWIVFTRVQGKLTKTTFGNPRTVTETAARKKAMLLVFDSKTGADPLAGKRSALNAPPFQTFVADYWRRWSPNWKPSTHNRNSRDRDAYLLPAFRSCFIDQISHAMVLDWFNQLSRSSAGAANRALGTLRHIFTKAEEWGVLPCDTNPCIGIRPNPRRKCTRFLHEDELQRLGATLDTLASTHPQQVGAVRLILFTGCRKMEILGLRWDAIAGHRMHLTDSKTGPRHVELGEAASAVLVTLPRIPGSPYVFGQAQSPSRHMSGILDFWRKPCCPRPASNHCASMTCATPSPAMPP
jgi:integrase